MIVGVGLPRTYHLVAMSLSKTFRSPSIAKKGGLVGLLERTVPPCARFTGPVPEQTFCVPDIPHVAPAPMHVPHAVTRRDSPQLSRLRKPPQFFCARMQSCESVSAGQTGSVA